MTYPLKVHVLSFLFLTLALACKHNADSSELQGRFIPERQTGSIKWATTPAKIEGEIGSIPVKNNPNVPFGLPVSLRSGTAIIISQPQFVLSWNRETRNADWAAWRLEKDDVGDFVRKNNFHTDKELDGYLRASNEDAVVPVEYKGSCLDRGHMVPSGDRTKDAETNGATFAMTNMLPETAFLNRRIWRHHEHQTRRLIDTHKCLWMVTGPIYGKTFGHIGPRKPIAVPKEIFKAVFTCTAPVKLLDAVIMPNVTPAGEDPLTVDPVICADNTGDSAVSQDLGDYASDLAEIQKKAHIRLLPSSRD